MTRPMGSAGSPDRARGSPAAPSARPPSRRRASTDPAGQLRGGVLVVAHPQRRRAPKLHVELERGIAHGLRERGQLGEAVETLAGAAQDRERIVARREQEAAIGRRRYDGQRLLDEPERLLGGIGRQGSRRSIDREARRAGRIAGGQRMLGQHGQSRRRGSPPSRSKSTTAACTCRRRAIESWLEANWRTCSCVNV